MDTVDIIMILVFLSVNNKIAQNLLINPLNVKTQNSIKWRLEYWLISLYYIN